MTLRDVGVNATVNAPSVTASNFIANVSSPNRPYTVTTVFVLYYFLVPPAALLQQVPAYYMVYRNGVPPGRPACDVDLQIQCIVLDETK